MKIKWALRRLKYLLINPRYFFLFFFGKPEKVISSLTGTSKSTFMDLKKELERDTSFIKEVNKKSISHMNREFYLGIDHFFLYALVRTIKPTLILETGVFHGHYTACLLKGVHDNYRDFSVDSRIISIDLPAYESISESTSEIEGTCLPTGCEPGWIIPEYLRDRWQLHTGDSRDLLPEVIRKENNISLFFHDSLHTYSHMMFEFETVFPLLKKGAYLMSHDIHWNHAFKHFVKKHNQKDFALHGFGIFKKT